MVIIKIPAKKNKLDYVYAILHRLIAVLKDYNFINCTESPIEELNYVKFKNLYYRYIDTKEVRRVVDTSKYISAYLLDVLDKKEYTINQYLEDCLLFELEEIRIVSKINDSALLNDIKQTQIFAKLLICPDGLREVQIIGDDNNLQIITEILTMWKK